MGKRLLRERLLNPIIDCDELNKRYDYIELFRSKYNDDYIYKILENNLIKNIGY